MFAVLFFWIGRLTRGFDNDRKIVRRVIIADAFKLRKQLEFSDDLTPAGNPKSLIEHLDTLEPPPESVLLVGHEPYLSRLISLLTTGGADLAMDFKKGGLCKLEIEKLSYGRCARLAWLLTPKLMKLMA